MTPQPAQLDALAAVCDLATFEAAAPHLQVTPSAISPRVRALESAAGRRPVRPATPRRPTDPRCRPLPLPPPWHDPDPLPAAASRADSPQPDLDRSTTGRPAFPGGDTAADILRGRSGPPPRLRPLNPAEAPATEVLVRRYEGSRRRHPLLAAGEGLAEAIERERALLLERARR